VKEVIYRISKGARKALRYDWAFVVWTVVLVVAGAELLSLCLVTALEDVETFAGDLALAACITVALLIALLSSASVLVGLSLVWSARHPLDGAFALGARCIWDDQPEQWERARIAFQEYLAKKHPEHRTREEVEDICHGLIRCIDTTTLLESSLPVLYEDAFGQPRSEVPELRELEFRLRRYRRASEQRRGDARGETDRPSQSA